VKQLPSRFRRLDGALADLPLEEPMLLTELDGFLTALVICPEPIGADEWMTAVWGADTAGVPPFEEPSDVQWFAGAVAARRAEIVRDLTRGKLQPILEVDERDGEVLWEYWIDGFGEAIALRPQIWAALADDPAWAAPLARLATLIAVARDESELDSVEVNAFQDRAAGELSAVVEALYAARVGTGEVTLTVAPTGASAVEAKVGRNDPCPCGSGRKHKHCCL